MIKLIREMKSKYYAGKDVIKLMILSSLFGVCSVIIIPMLVCCVHICLNYIGVKK